ncbi:esterase/lipase family protein [Nevskia soli]|jgi:pimeloyl-ACP methyl ester carboxylesterase|uniref:esterase/lipase family protein n=1 Tax=Nevskia soli TaxID=418856 RepID=UPI0015D85479|nr:hypothetical protein [Nevskia soli]
MNNRTRFALGVFAILLPALGPTAWAQTAPTPEPAPGGAANIFYGALVPGGDPNAPVLLYVHGLGTNATFWFTGSNDMYQDAYTAGYRTVFVSLSADNSDNTATIADNAAMLQQLLPQILTYENVSTVYLICHSKGGLDAEDAMLTSASFMSSVKMVFTLATPNQGAELADWAYGAGKSEAKKLGLLSPGMANLRTSVVHRLRKKMDPVFETAGIPFYTLEGTDYSAEHNLIYDYTGRVLAGLVSGPNDGLVAESEVPLPTTYSLDMGQVAVDHNYVGHGTPAWPFIADYLPAP